MIILDQLLEVLGQTMTNPSHTKWSHSSRGAMGPRPSRSERKRRAGPTEVSNEPAEEPKRIGGRTHETLEEELFKVFMLVEGPWGKRAETLRVSHGSAWLRSK